MTISLLQMQFQRLLSCNCAVYAHYSLANGFDTLKDAGFEEEILVDYPIDETLSLREFEEELEERFHFSLELCNKDSKPFTNKSLRLFQLFSVCSLTDDSEQRNQQLDSGLDKLLKMNNRQQPPLAC
ncbi:hypothetical protein DCC81_05645 [Chitinophaga parva]|uniref:Uncharacterized protein n=1 Tax=Chitinophaga parva TaxID=2169414 RepID=A0A2T7BMR7_9BACT|nr:hypothetical protein [Chitinophaga parva]PUZ28956.1 hypothetical protein DCC81_05645 [Chitinophaga parva]